MRRGKIQVSLRCWARQLHNKVDKGDPKYGRPALQRASVFVNAEDADRIPNRVSIEQVTVTEKVTVEMARLWGMRKTTDSKTSTPHERCVAFFAEHADLWAQAEYTALGRRMLKYAEAKGLPANTLAAVKALYGL